MPDLVLDYHRLKTPIDHPDLSITRAKLEYPTVNVNLGYLAVIGKALECAYRSTYNGAYRAGIFTYYLFTDKAVAGVMEGGYYDDTNIVRWSSPNDFYSQATRTNAAAADELIVKRVAGVSTTLATEAVDLDDGPYMRALSISGSTLKTFRDRGTYKDLNEFINAIPTLTPKLSATDTAIASGRFGQSVDLSIAYFSTALSYAAMLISPASPSPPAQSIIEVNLEGSGKPEDPFRPAMSKNLVEITSLTGLPDFLYREAKKYQILKSKGFTDEEIQLLLGYIPQHQVDLDSVTWGAFEFHPDKAPTAIITVIADNPYKSAILRQINFARKNLRVFSPPRDYSEAVTLYNQLRRDYTHWLAGKDNFAYQTLGWEILDWMQSIDFYHGELLDHKTHYNQLKQVLDWEITNRLNELIDKLSRETTLTDEREKHIAKAKEVLKKGW